VELTVKSKDGSVKKREQFSFYWTDTPNTEFDLNAAFDQMVYIVNEDSLKKYKNAPLEQKKIFFNRFWAEHDPDPNTSKNELKNEYFRRINFSNQRFTVLGQPGWATDRGRILIKFGFPDDIERHPFELGTKPYEIWRYYSLRKTFLFHDMSGFGDYRLDPAFLDEEFR
jgi:GWxTD domain-containing protein